MDLSLASARFTYLDRVWRYRWRIAAWALICALAAMALSFLKPPVYRSSATLVIEQARAQIVSIESVTKSPDAIAEAAYFSTQVELLKSTEVALRVIHALNLEASDEFKKATVKPSSDGATGTSGIVSRITALFKGDGDSTQESPGGSTARGESSLDALVAQFHSRSEVRPIGLSRLVRISFDSSDPELSARIANQIANEYLQLDRDSRLKVSQSALAYLQDRLTVLRDDLTRSERALQEYRDEKGIVNVSGAAQTLAGQQLGAANEKLSAARSRRAELESAYQLLQASRSSDLSRIPQVAASSAVAAAQGRVNAARTRLAEESQTLGPAHIRIRQIESEIAQLNANLRREQEQAAAALTLEYRAARRTEEAIEKELGIANQGVQLVDREEPHLVALGRSVATNRMLYDMFLSRSREMSLASDLQADVGRIVDVARPPTKAVWPNRSLLLAGALAFALLSGSFVSYLVGGLRGRFNNGEQVAMRLEARSVTCLPRIRRAKGSASRHSLTSPDSDFGEAMRALRANLVDGGDGAARRIILISSSVAGEGVTTVACNLALLLAQVGPTLLVDASSREPAAGRSLGAERVAEHEGIYHVPDSSLRVLAVRPDGEAAPAVPLLESDLRNRLASSGDAYRFVVIDLPPVGTHSDVQMLMKLATDVLVVVKAGSTRETAVRRTLARVAHANTPGAFVVLNQMDPQEWKQTDYTPERLENGGGAFA